MRSQCTMVVIIDDKTGDDKVGCKGFVVVVIIMIVGDAAGAPCWLSLMMIYCKHHGQHRLYARLCIICINNSHDDNDDDPPIISVTITLWTCARRGASLWPLRVMMIRMTTHPLHLQPS